MTFQISAKYDQQSWSYFSLKITADTDADDDYDDDRKSDPYMSPSYAGDTTKSMFMMPMSIYGEENYFR